MSEKLIGIEKKGGSGGSGSGGLQSYARGGYGLDLYYTPSDYDGKSLLSHAASWGNTATYEVSINGYFKIKWNKSTAQCLTITVEKNCHIVGSFTGATTTNIDNDYTSGQSFSLTGTYSSVLGCYTFTAGEVLAY